MPPPPGAPNPLAGPADYLTNPVHNDTYPAIDPTKVDLKGKRVMIVGASRGIGRAIAISFARAGASYIAIGARSDQTHVIQDILAAAESAGRDLPRPLRLHLDIKSTQSVANAAALIGENFEGLDVIVYNAGALGEVKLIADGEPEYWWNTWAVNVRGLYLVTRALLPLMLKGGDKTIVVVSSTVAHNVHTYGVSDYETSKLAQLRFAEFISAEYGDKGALAYCIHPGNIATNMWVGGVPDDLKHVVVETPELPADTLVYLTKEKREWLAGRYINCTWDMPQVMAMQDEIVKEDKLKVRLVV
ncbi:MAG: hypothetical protein Q9201_004598 [Fulgogasparrea decipioides]